VVVSVAVAELPSAPAAFSKIVSLTSAGPVYTFGPTGTQFSSPGALLTLKFDFVQGGGLATAEAEPRYAIFKLDVLSGTWEEKQGTIVDVVAKLASVRTLSFSQYAVMRVVNVPEAPGMCIVFRVFLHCISCFFECALYFVFFCMCIVFRVLDWNVCVLYVMCACTCVCIICINIYMHAHRRARNAPTGKFRDFLCVCM
jgi:hypothetical protein